MSRGLRRGRALAIAAPVLLAMLFAPGVAVRAQLVPGVPTGTAPIKPPAKRTSFTWTGTLSQGGLIRGQAPAGATAVLLDGKPVTVAQDGRFIVGFDRDAPGTALLVAQFADGQRITQPLTIAPRAWNISRLSTLPKTPVPEPTFQKIRPQELGEIAAAREIKTDAAGWGQAFRWPVTGRISTLFGAQRIYKNGEEGSYHSGVDVARPTGTPVVAPADGVVILATDRPFTLEGRLLMIDHGMGLNSAFLHLSRIDVKAGDHVRQGQPVGAIGTTGRSTGPHLHWGMRWRDAKLDPMLAAGTMPAR